MKQEDIDYTEVMILKRYIKNSRNFEFFLP